jgi:hypothetical protein
MAPTCHAYSNIFLLQKILASSKTKYQFLGHILSHHQFDLTNKNYKPNKQLTLKEQLLLNERVLLDTCTP